MIAAGGTPLRGRRLQDDCLLDTADGFLRERGSVLRVRQESGTSLLTFKGPVQPSVMKLREELETAVGDGTLVLRLLEELGFRVWFRYQKYREEFALENTESTSSSPSTRRRSGLTSRSKGTSAESRRRPGRSAVKRPTTSSIPTADCSSATASNAVCRSPT